jgi:hypothetical protein
VVARASVRLANPGSGTIRLPLPASVRKQLRARRTVRLTIEIRAADAHERTVNVALKRGSR